MIASAGRTWPAMYAQMQHHLSKTPLHGEAATASDQVAEKTTISAGVLDQPLTEPQARPIPTVRSTVTCGRSQQTLLQITEPALQRFVLALVVGVEG